jgi:hypothetical protein
MNQHLGRRKIMQGKGGGKSMAYTIQEKMKIAELCDRELPIGNRAWMKLMEEYNSCFPGHEQTRQSLGQQFYKMHTAKPPSGDPTIPEHIQLAKDAQAGILQKAEHSNGTSDEDFEVPGAVGDGNNEEAVQEKKMQANKNKFMNKTAQKKEHGGTAL